MLTVVASATHALMDQVAVSAEIASVASAPVVVVKHLPAATAYPTAMRQMSTAVAVPVAIARTALTVLSTCDCLSNRCLGGTLLSGNLRRLRPERVRNGC